MKPFEGQHVWIWELDKCCRGDARSIIDRCRKYGIRGLLIKYHEGKGVTGAGSGDFRARFLRVVQPLKDAGIIIGSWGFNYFSDTHLEAKLALESLENGADWYVANAEAPVESATDNRVLTTRFLETIRQQKPSAVIGYSTYAYPNYHKRFPYHEFDLGCDVALPQTYWATIGTSPTACLNSCITSHVKAGLTKPIMPVGQAYDHDRGAIDAMQMVQFKSWFDVWSEKIPGISWWSWQHMDLDIGKWDALTALPMYLYFSSAKFPVLKCGERGHSVSYAKSMLGMKSTRPEYDMEMLYHVMAFQQKANLVVDGIIGPKTWDAMKAR